MSSSRKPEIAGEVFGRRQGTLFSALSQRVSSGSDEHTALRDYRILASLVGLAGVVALAAVPALPVWAAPLGLAFGVLYYVIFARRERRRAAVLAQPFPEPWQKTLSERVPLYLQLTDEEKRRFEGEVAVFLAEQRIYSLGGLEGEAESQVQLTDEHRVLIAASAAILLLGRPDWRLPTERDIVVYPSSFAEETYSMEGGAHTIGLVHAQGPILFAIDAIERSFPRRHSWPSSSQWLQPPPLAQSHVGLHEFAHVLDFLGQQGRSTGVPVLLPPSVQAQWHDQLAVERDRLMMGDSVLNPYGLKNEAELFAVSVESFFQDAQRLRLHHPALYKLLADFFNQDPAERLVPLTPVASFRPWFALGGTTRYIA